MDPPWRVVLDPNVLVSAAITPIGATARIVELIDAGAIVPVVSPLLIAELTAVLRRPRFRRYLDLSRAADPYGAGLSALNHSVGAYLGRCPRLL